MGLELQRIVALLAAATVISGCTTTGAADSGTSTTVESSTSGPTSSTTVTSTSAVPVTSTTTTRAPRSSYERPCGSRISSGYGAPGSDIPILHIGPVALLAFDTDWLAANTAEYSTPDADGRYAPIKYVLVVSQDAVGPVSVSIPEPGRELMRLVYDPDVVTPLLWGEADHTVEFGACDGLDAQYNGGIIIRGPVCVGIEVSDLGVDGSRWAAGIPIGVDPDSCELGE